MDKLVEPKSSELVVFDEVAATIAKWKAENEKLVFKYDTPQGEKDARSHIAKLRKGKTKVSEVHKAAKAEALAFGRRLDAKKNEYNGEIDKMVTFHKAPLDDIENERTEAALAKQREYADAEAKRIAEIEARERAITLAEEKIAREKDEAKEKIAQEEAEEAERIIKEQREKIRQVEEEKRIVEEKVEKVRIQVEEKAKAEAEAEEERLADIAAEKAIEANRIADKKHRAKIESEVIVSLKRMGFDDEKAIRILAAIIDNAIPHITINY